jgi:penicillin-binding protein 2
MKNKLFVIEENPRHIKDSRLSTYNSKDSFSFVESDDRRDTLKANISKKRITTFFIFIFVIILIFAVRLFYLQIIQGEKWQLIAEGNRIRVEKETPPRGIIFDSNGKTLVNNIPNFILSFIPADISDKEEGKKDILNFVKEEFPELDINNFEQTMNSENDFPYEPIEIIDNIIYEQAMNLRLKLKDYPALKLTYVSNREYIEESYGLAHTLGYLGKINEQEWDSVDKSNYLLIDFIGRSGLEKEYEDALRGKVGLKEIEVDVLGRVKKVISEQPSQSGDNLTLSIDSELNKIFSDILCSSANSFEKKAAGIALNPQNGEILAMVSCPIYDNNYFTNTLKNAEEITKLMTDEKQPLFNRTIQGEYPPGSIFKLVVGASGLEEGVINRNTRFLSVGGISIGQWFFPDWKGGGHGSTDITKAIAESVNTFFYYTGGGYKDEFGGLGLNRIVDYAERFGYGKEQNIDLPGEAKGFLPDQVWKQEVTGRPWYIGDTYHLSIGQGDIIVTPLQIASVTSYFANHGVLYKPHIVKERVDYRNTKNEIKPKIIKKDIVGQNHTNLIRKGLRDAVTYGSAVYLSDLPVSVAGKTGTAQVGGDKEAHAWFTGFAPYDDSEIVITVLVENGEEGSRIAVPVAKEVLRWYFGQ